MSLDQRCSERDLISLNNLAAVAHQAFKRWHQPDQADCPLAQLQLVQQTLRERGESNHEASRKVLLAALDALAVDDQEDALLLRLHFVDRLVMTSVAHKLHLAETTAYRRQQRALRRLATILQAMEQQARIERLERISARWTRPTAVPLIGVDHALRDLWRWVCSDAAPWLVSIEGLGGIGKTSLANALVTRLIDHSHFDDIAWINARRDIEWTEIGPKQAAGPHQPVLDSETFVDLLLEQVGHPSMLVQSPQGKLITLCKLLKSRTCLVVIDNLETEVDSESLLPTLRQLANPSKFLLTSRRTLQQYADVSGLLLSGLSREETVAFLQQEANIGERAALQQADQAQLDRIYDVVGGNPLALKLVVGLTQVLPLAQVLDNLRQALGREVDEFYTYIYWQAWHSLDRISRQLLLVMPLAQHGDLEQLEFISQLEPVDLHQALRQLVNRSLVISRGDLENRRYSIHRLTETFLLNEVIKWQMES